MSSKFDKDAYIKKLGLTQEEVDKWEKLEDKVERLNMTCVLHWRFKNHIEEDYQRYKAAAEELINFKKEHHIENKFTPSYAEAIYVCCK